MTAVLSESHDAPPGLSDSRIVHLALADARVPRFGTEGS